MRTATGGPAKSLFNPPFVIAVAVLATAAFGIGPRLFRDAGPKLAVPLKKPLQELDKGALGPYTFQTQVPLSPAVQEVLGTDEFIDWRLVDSRIQDVSSPLRTVRFTVSYYSGGREQAPHTPDQCMLGAGYDPKIAENLDIEIPSLGHTIPVRVLTFEKTAIMNHEKPTVAYFFVCNGQFLCTREGVRSEMNSLHHKHAYFAKVELGFTSSESTPAMAPRDESITATADFLDHVLPVLLRDVLPDWSEIVEQEEAARQSAS
ncbi:MAG TPA: hypothetical protein P5572_00540 [Phycisphaerae bacterium]|nr:hypothetical protein [Phycisphaerae bacterium]